MALAEYEVTVKRLYLVIKLLLGSLDTLSSDFLKFLSCFKDRKRKRSGRGPRACPFPTPEKKLTDLHHLEKWV